MLVGSVCVRFVYLFSWRLGGRRRTRSQTVLSLSASWCLVREYQQRAPFPSALASSILSLCLCLCLSISLRRLAAARLPTAWWAGGQSGAAAAGSGAGSGTAERLTAETCSAGSERLTPGQAAPLVRGTAVRCASYFLYGGESLGSGCGIQKKLATYRYNCHWHSIQLLSSSGCKVVQEVYS